MKYIMAIVMCFVFLGVYSTVSAKEEHHDEHTDEHHAEVFKISASAEKNFALKYLILKGSGPWTIPTGALMTSGLETNIYRHRAGEYLRIDFKSLRQTSSEVQISSDDLKAGDQVVIAGVAFLRTVELMNSDGAPEGHSH